MNSAAYDDLTRRKPFYLKHEEGFFTPVKIVDLSPTEKLLRAQFPWGERAWFRADALYADRKGTPARVDPANWREPTEAERKLFAAIGYEPQP